jgi:hypothetical protein
MNDVDKKLEEMLKGFLLIDVELRKRFGDFDMKDILLTKSMKDPVPSECVFPMDFKYHKK